MPTEIVPARAPPAPAAPVVVADLVAMIVSGLKPKSAEGYRKDFRAFQRFTGSPSIEAALLSLFALSGAAANYFVLGYQDSMAALAPATVNRRLAALQRAVHRARFVGLTTLVLETESQRAEAFRDVRGPGAKGWGKLLARAELEAAGGELGAARNLVLILLLHDRGLRRGEAAGLDWPDDVDVTRPAVAVVGKGEHDKAWLTINDPTRDALARYVLARGDQPGPLFVRADRAAGMAAGASRLNDESINRMVKALAKRAGLKSAVRAHGLRHCGITEALDRGWDVRDVKAFSRHKRIDTVLIYDDRRKDVGGDITRSLGKRKKGG